MIEEPKNRQTNPDKKHLWAFIEGNHFLKTLRNLWYDEKEGLRKGWLGTLITSIIFGILGYFAGVFFSGKSIAVLNTSNSILTTIIQSNSISGQNLLQKIQDLNQNIQEKNAEIAKISSERDKAQIEKQIAQNAVASWELLAKSSNTNTPLTERLDNLMNGLAKNTEMQTKTVIDSIDNADTFEVLVNKEEIKGIPLSQDRFTSRLSEMSEQSPVHLTKSRSVFITVVNNKEYQLNSLTITLAAPLSGTNVEMSGTWSGPIIQTFSFDSATWNLWRMDAQMPITGMTKFNATTFNISTNFQGASIPIIIDIDALGKRAQRFYCKLIL